MTDRIMLRARADEHTINFRTVSARMKSPQRFFITYGELDRLQRDGSLISNDIRSFAKLRLDENRDRLTFDFTWLSDCCENGPGGVKGYEQTVNISWSKFQVFLENCRLPDGPKEFKAISLDVRRSRPRLVFDGNRANLRAAIGNPLIRRKLGKALMANFNWPDAEQI